MTISNKESIIEYTGDGALVAFSYQFRADNDEDISVYLEGVKQATGYILVREVDNIGGLVTFDVAPVGGALVAIRRIVAVDQLTDYQPYDPFPAETHERALDKLTMIAQQTEVTSLQAIRVPESEDPTAENLTTPIASVRAEKVLYFDHEGNVSVIDPVVDSPAVLRIDIQDGTGGDDSRNVLAVDTVSGGSSYPKIGFRNINKANGPVQLDAEGNLPPGLVNVTGIHILGPLRGDNLCPKPSDTGGECTDPDTRNPSQLYPSLAASYKNGDAYIITMESGEASGTMLLFEYSGDPAEQVLTVVAGDGVMFLTEVEDADNPGVILVQEGWYLFPNLSGSEDAVSIYYDSSGNVYVLGVNVQAALDAIDNQLQDRDAWAVTQRSATREGIVVADANLIAASGFYQVLAGGDNLPTAGSNYAIICTTLSADEFAQIAVDVSTSATYSRVRDGGSWTAWERHVSPADFLRTGDRLDMYNVRTS